MVTLKPSIFSDPDNLPAIGLDPRFAGLIRLAALGYRGKTLETRGFATAYRGPLVILATSGERTANNPELGKAFDQARRELCDVEVPGDVFDHATDHAGFALVLATVTDVRPLTETDWPRAFFKPSRDKPRFAWTLTNLWPLCPFPSKAAQLFSRVSADHVLGGLVNELATHFGGSRTEALNVLRRDDLPGLGAERWAGLVF